MAEVPKLLGGRYEVDTLLGRGGMAEVHLGYDTRLGRQVAIKMLRSELARDQTFITRFRREAQSAAGLNHASIVAVYDHGEDAVIESGGAEVRVPYIVMEFVDGKTLREVITERGTFAPTEALRVTEGVLDALAYSHRNGIVHRDIKPANVMIAADGTIKVMDFGIARALADANATMTQTQSVVGTAQYLSPEQAQGQPVDERSDLYSAGCMLFELLTGRAPFLGESMVSIAYQHVGEQPLPPSRFVEGISEDLDAVVMHALAKPRDARYQNAGEFRSDLQAVRLERPISSAAKGTAAALAGAVGATAVGAAATEALPAVGPEQTQVISGAVVPLDEVPPGTNTDTFPALSDDTEEKRSRSGWVVLAIFAVAAVVALAFGLSTYFGEDEIPPVAVPTVVDKPLQTAIADLARAGLEEDVVRQASDTVPGRRRHQPDADRRHRGGAGDDRAPGRVVRADGDHRARPQRPHRGRGAGPAQRPQPRARHRHRGRRRRDDQGPDHRLQPGGRQLGGTGLQDQRAGRQRTGPRAQRRRQAAQRGPAAPRRREPRGGHGVPPDQRGARGPRHRAGPAERQDRHRGHGADHRGPEGCADPDPDSHPHADTHPRTHAVGHARTRALPQRVPLTPNTPSPHRPIGHHRDTFNRTARPPIDQ